MTKKLVSLAREFASTVLLVVIVFAASRLLVQNVQVRGLSMYPTLQNGEYMLVDTLSYRLHGPNRGDIIIFHPPVDHEDYVKRVIGLPGELVGVKEGAVYINGKPLTEPYLRMPHTYNWAAERVPPGDVFVLGDNRDQSYDSHWWANAQGKPIPWLAENQIIGRAMLSYWPPSDLRLFTAPAFAGVK